ncbi:hypothetical protein B0O80DRAFT_519751 [Mortierella sp. GBAus27b]|nr:hypothetical protein B0O80DRAFT_519751 [Mortierella sp. GBAus27b]
MEITQSFRLAGTTDILEIPCDQDDGQVVIYWDDILEAFPGVQYVKNGNTFVRRLKNPGLDGKNPVRIKYHPGVILDVVSSTPTSAASEDVESSMLVPKQKENVPEPVVDMDVIENIQVSTLVTDGNHIRVDNVPSVASISESVSRDPSVNMEAILLPKQVAALWQTNHIGSGSETRVVPSMEFVMQEQIPDSSRMHGWIVQAVRDGQVDRLSEQLMACLQGLKDEITKTNELTTKNNELVSQVKNLALKNNEMASKNNDLALNNNELASRNNEMATKNNELVSQVKKLALKNNELATKNNELASSNSEMASKNIELVSSNMESTAMVIKLQEQFNVKQDEMKLLQIQALDQLSLLQNRVQALMNQTYELHEYPIPRLFVVLPQDSSSWNPKDFISNKFRLYFLCECGDHTRRSTCKIPHHIHLAKHEGYEITRPKEFFQQYGHYVLTILKMLKFGVAVTGVAIPALTLLVRVEALDRASSSLKMLIGNLQTGMDQAIGGLEKSATDNNGPEDETSQQIGNNMALEGADLRKLETFLKDKDGNKAFGNLYRTTTSEGHVKWVCIDHYRENYHEKAAKAFRDTVESMGGSFDESIGRVNVHIRSKIQADQFYQALENARSVYELEIGLNWDTAYSDFKKLRDCVLKSNVGALYINLHRQDTLASDILNRGKRHDPILEIIRHPSTRSASIVGAPDDFIKRSSLLSRNDDFSNLRILEIDLFEFQKDIPGLKSMISKMSHLTKLTMNDSGDKVDHVCDVCGATGSSKGSLEVNENRVKCHVRSRVQAEIVYLMLESSKSVHGLSVDLQVDLNGSSTGDIPERIQRHDSIFNIMRHPSTNSVAIMGAPRDFIQRSNLSSTADNFLNLENLHIDVLALKQDLPGLKSVVSRIPKLDVLTVVDFGDRRHHVCSVCDAVNSLERSFEVNFGRVKIRLLSRIQAELVLQVLETTTTISGCDIDLHVELKDGSTGDTSDRIRGHESIFSIMLYPSTHSVVIVEPPEDFIQQSSLLSRDDDFPSVKQLNIDMSTSKRDIPGLKTMVSRMPNLTSLTVNTASDGRSNHAHGSSDTEGPSRRSFEVHSGRVTIQIWSGIELDLVYQAFETIQSIYGLDIDLTVDMKDISGDTTDRIQRHDAIFDIMRHPSTHSVTITGAPPDFIQESSLVSRTEEFTCLKHLDLDLSAGLEHDTSGVRALLSRMPILASLALYDSCHKKVRSRDGSSMAMSLQRCFEVNGGRVKAHIRSRTQAELVFHVLWCTKSISGLSIDLCVELDDSSTDDISDSTRGCGLVFDIMRHPSTQSVELVKAPLNSIGQLSTLPRNDDFSHLKRFSVDLCIFKQDISSIKALLSRIPSHSALRINNSRDKNTHILFGSSSMEPLERSVDGSSDCVRIHLGSRALMELMDGIIERTSSTNEIDIGLHWIVTKDDLEKLRDILTETNVKGVRLHVNMDSTGDESTGTQRNDAFFNIMGHTSVDSIAIMRPSTNMIRQSSLLSRHDFYNLKSLVIEVPVKEDISVLKYLISKVPNLSGLTFQGGVDNLLLLSLYIVIAEYQTYPITFANRNLVIPPWTTTRQPLSASQCLTQLFSLASIQMARLDLNGSAWEELAVDALAKLERGLIGLRYLHLSGSFRRRKDQLVKNIARVIARHEVGMLELGLHGFIREESAMRVLSALEGDQWKRIRHLRITLGNYDHTARRAMKTLVEGDKVHGPFELDYFSFYSTSPYTVSSECAALFKSFVASTPIKKLELCVKMTPSDMESVINSMDVTRLEEIILWPQRYSSSEVDRVLDCLPNAHNLQKVKVKLYSYLPTQEQIQRMQERGVQLF